MVSFYKNGTGILLQSMREFCSPVKHSNSTAKHSLQGPEICDQELQQAENEDLLVLERFHHHSRFRVSCNLWCYCNHNFDSPKRSSIFIGKQLDSKMAASAVTNSVFMYCSQSHIEWHKRKVVWNVCLMSKQGRRAMYFSIPKWQIASKHVKLITLYITSTPAGAE